jgi:uncharacterized protein (DUF433 family)
MTYTIKVSKDVYTALQQQAMYQQTQADQLAEGWLKQHLNLAAFPDLEWRQGAGGWRIGVKGTAIDVYTIVGYSQAGFSVEEIADEALPPLSKDQVRSALHFYAEHPDEIDQILAESESEVSKARLYRALGPEGYQRLTGSLELPALIRESKAKYKSDEPD